MLSEELALVRLEEPTLARGRVVGALAEKLLRCLEVSDLDERLARIEAALDGTTTAESARRWGT